MGAVRTWFKPDRLDPAFEQSGILASGYVKSVMEPAWPKILLAQHQWVCNPLVERLPGALGDFKLDRRFGFRLQN